MAESYEQLLNKIAFAQTVAGLSTYFGLTTPQDSTEVFALRSVQGFTNLLPNQQIRPNQSVSRIVDDVINTTGGAFTTAQTARRIFRFLEGSNNVTANNTSEGTRATISRTIKLFCAANTADQGNNTGQIDPTDFYQPLIGPVIGQESGQGIINRNPKNPTKLEPTLSVFQINSVLALPTSKNTNGICLFLNGVPSLELARSVPYLDVKFLFGRDPYRISDGKLQTNSLLRAIEGAISVNGNRVLQTLAEANTVSGSSEGSRSQLGVTSVAGMEMFLQPQLLVNANEFFNPQTRAVPVLDPFRPLLTFKEFAVDVAQAAGMASYKTAKLGFVLHDRSRMTEVAEFLKPDLYGATELLIEYGWSHPDVSYRNGTNAVIENPYGVLINGMRVKEKYGIRNIQAAFDDSGQVGITLDLFMKGADELRSVQIASAETGTTEIIREIENLSSLIHAYERRLTPTNSSTQIRSPEIRGSQILQNASDYQSHVQLSQEILSNLREFRQSLQRTRNVDRERVITPLLNALDNLYRNRTSPSRTNDSSGGAVARLSTTTQRSIEEKMRRIATPNNDPFLPANLERGTRESRLGRLRRTNGSTNTNTAVRQANIDLTNIASHVSLGKLLLNFVGIPLCLTNKFDDVQFLFYPFNAYAGKANSLNISQFIVDTAFFIRQYTRLRTESVSRSANLSLAEFLSFLTTTILDDNGAESYGIWSAFERVFDSSTGVESVQGRGNQVEFQQRMENILRNQTPDGTFKMPQIDFFLETLPGKNTEESGDTSSGTNLERSILRIHVYDKQCTQYEAQGSILGSSRDSILSSIGSVPQTATSLGNNDVLDTHRANFVAVRQLAGNLVEEVGQGTGQYRVTGGAQRIKEFVMSTMPYIVYGAYGTAIRGNASLQSQQDSALSTINMLRSLRNDPLEPNGEQPGGIPLSIIPAQLSFNTYGCPLIDFAQQFFIDFQTGTSWDNIYGVVGLSHKLTAGDFSTEIKFAPLDAYGKYRSMIEQINFFSQRLRAAS